MGPSSLEQGQQLLAVYLAFECIAFGILIAGIVAYIQRHHRLAILLWVIGALISTVLILGTIYLALTTHVPIVQ